MTRNSTSSDSELTRGGGLPSANVPNDLVKFVQDTWTDYDNDHWDQVCNFDIPRPIDAIHEMDLGVVFEIDQFRHTNRAAAAFY